MESQVTQHEYGESGSEARSASASNAALPSEHFPPAKSTQFAGHLMIKTTWLSGSHASSTVVLSLTYCG